MTNGKKKAGVTRQRVGKLMRTLFEILLEHPDGIQAQLALAKLEQRVPPTEHESGHYQSGGRRYEKIVRFSTVDLVKAGWMLKDKGLWSATETGQEAFAAIQDPTAFYKRACELYQVWKSAQPDPTDAETETVEDAEVEQTSPTQTFEQAEENAWNEIWDYLQRIDPYNLQKLVAGLLEAMGYHVSWIAPPGKDGGMDVLAWTDPLGTKPPRIKVQVKRRKDAIAVDELRSFMAVLSDNDVGLFVTTGRFTKDAHDEARLQERRKITLIDRERLVELWIQYMDRLSEDARQLLPLRPIYFLAPS
ncbi:restriction endonuclease [Rhabdochromatium marinum]|uniref:restriction endonuclease n=1 Tax=Rhabdochromatium marinum TaxID=48729 RepID=UPI0019046FCD|nr:restriction endonuclease [Rhabdochromatium marinum]MBK1650367.1 restriction endonuclease [Rhabdochromatium marinum]